MGRVEIIGLLISLKCSLKGQGAEKYTHFSYLLQNGHFRFLKDALQDKTIVNIREYDVIYKLLEIHRFILLASNKRLM